MFFILKTEKVFLKTTHIYFNYVDHVEDWETWATGIMTKENDLLF